jgi:thymidylate synthase
MEIIAQTIAEAHERVVASIMQKSIAIDIETEPGKWEKTWEYPDAVMVIIRTPLVEPQVSEACLFGERSIQKYCEDICNLKLKREYVEGMEPVYTYPWRLYDYPRVLPVDVADGEESHTEYFRKGNGDGGGINQIAQIILRLRKNRESRRANAVTWVPEIDGEANNDQPCLQVVHCMIRDDFLHMRCFFRSHDMMSGAGPNWVGLTALQEKIAFGTDSKVGSLTTVSSSAHLYWKRDDKELKLFKKALFKKYRMFLGED